VKVRAISPALLVEQIADRIAREPRDAWVRVAVDGAPAAAPGRLADELVDPLRLRGRPVLRVSADDFLRPASLRLEFGRADPDVYYSEWLNTEALKREVFGPLAPGGTGRVLPSLWDAATDRATRADYVDLAVGGVLVLDGALLLGRGLPLDVTVHLSLSAAALERRVPSDQSWTIPAYQRYQDEVDPESAADFVVRMDDAKHPAMIERA
jgi:hypothetical protein